MKWLNRLLGRRTVADVHFEPNIRFLGEQDGRVEQIIKQQWKLILSERASVQRAYFAIATFDRAATYQAVLCIRHAKGDDLALVEALSTPFRETFNSQEFLEIMFLSPEYESDVRKVCRPFYDAEEPLKT